MTAAERELTRALALLRLEVHGDIVDHIQVKAEEAIRQAREEGEEAVRMERIRLTALWEERMRMARREEMREHRQNTGCQLTHRLKTTPWVAIRSRAQECQHVWGIDGAHSNEYCKRCFVSRAQGGE